MASDAAGPTRPGAVGLTETMVPAQRIVVGYDSSAEAASALQWAVAESLHHRTDLSVVACLAPVGPDGETECPPLAPVLTAAAQLMSIAPQEARPKAFHLQVVQDIPWMRLATESTGSEMLVIGTSSHLLLGAWRLGAVTHELLQRVVCPVALIPRHVPSQLFRRVVVAVDGTTSDAALRWAAQRAEDHESELVVVHASEQRSEPRDRSAEHIVDEACRQAEQLTSQPVTRRVIDGPITSSLLTQGFHADVLVLGTGGIRHAGQHSGSVARAIAACATSPTVLIRQPIVHQPEDR